jgi:hypothetical protein
MDPVLPSPAVPAAPVVDEPEAEAAVEPGPEAERLTLGGIVTARIVDGLQDDDLAEQEGERLVVVGRAERHRGTHEPLLEHRPAERFDVGDVAIATRNGQHPDRWQHAGMGALDRLAAASAVGHVSTPSASFNAGT